MDVLVIGRYDPFHLGHWQLVHEALEQFHQAIVGIRDTPDDLFPTDDRFRIAVKALDGIERCTVVKIPDLDQCQRWQDVASFDVVMTGNEQVKQAVRPHYAVIEAARHGHYSATEVRRRLEADLDFGEMVVPGTETLIRQLYLRQRIRHGAA